MELLPVRGIFHLAENGHSLPPALRMSAASHPLPMSPDDVAAIAVILLIGSEALSLNPSVKSNGWIQLFLAAFRGIAKWK